jgi:predicted deacetylase
MRKLEVEERSILRWTLSEQKDRTESTIRYNRQMAKTDRIAENFHLQLAETQVENLKILEKLIELFEENETVVLS